MSNTLQIVAPACFEAEKKYIIDVILNEFLGLPYELSFTDVAHYIIVLPNQKKLFFLDSFFAHFDEQEGYLSLNNIPSKVSFIENPFLKEKDLPVIFGNSDLSISEEIINSGVDIFASSFFMLTRWEEYVNKERDQHDRFLGSFSLAHKNEFLHRPIVNEYVEMLWEMLLRLGFEGKRKKHQFNWLITHDIDVLKKWMSYKKIFRTFFGDIFLRKNIWQALRSFKSWAFTKIGLVKDPFDRYQFLMDISEKMGTKSHFFFMAGGTSKYDNEYEIEQAKEIISNIRNRGHEVGFHPSYNAHNNVSQFNKEKARLEKVIGGNVKTGRQHFLRCELPQTMQQWDDAEMHWDSTLGYADEPGFRCGVCYEYPYFNFVSRKKLEIRQKPMILMEASLVNYKNCTPEETRAEISFYVKQVKKYQGDFVFLWHNSSFELSPFEGYEFLYESFVTENE